MRFKEICRIFKFSKATATGFVRAYQQVTGAISPGNRKESNAKSEREDPKMKATELKVNEMKQINGGNFFADLEEVLRNIFAEPSEPSKPGSPIPQEPVNGRGKC